MNVEVYYGGQRGGHLPYSVLPAFRLFCKQNGFQIKWDAQNKRIDMEPGLKGKICALAAGLTAKDTSLEKQILGKTEKFLSDYGAEIVLVTSKADMPKGMDVGIQFSVKEVRTALKPRLLLFQREDEKHKRLLMSLRAELKQTGIACLVNTQKEGRFSHSFLTIQLLLPKDTDAATRKAYGEKIAFYLSSGILRYFLVVQKISPVSYLHPHLLTAFLSSLTDRQETTEPEAFQVEEERAEGQDSGTLTMEQDMNQEEPSANRKEEVERQEVVSESGVNQVNADGKLVAEVYFDYTVFHSDVEQKPFLLIGNLYVKNTGTEVLYNPIVCFRVSPFESIKLGGQILPPKLVETMGVQSSTGIKGWRYLEDDWFSQAKERGEYWIAPIQPIQIAPGTMEAFQNFQISILKPEIEGAVTMEGVVLFNEQGVHFPANNRIAISF